MESEVDAQQAAMLHSSNGIAESMKNQVDILKKELASAEKYRMKDNMGLGDLKALIDESRVEL